MRKPEPVGPVAESEKPGAPSTADEAMKTLADYDKQIEAGLKDYLPGSDYIVGLRKRREAYLKEVGSVLMEAYAKQKEELAGLEGQMRGDSEPVRKARERLSRLEKMCGQLIAHDLLKQARESKDVDAAMELLRKCLEHDPGNQDAKEQMEQRGILANSIGAKLVRIPAGRFLMGSSGRSNDENQHEVVISKGFWMGSTEVTQAQWKAVMGSNPSKFKGDNLPVEQVTWDDAVKFCGRLSEKEGKKYRLPTEAEWEFACRAGTTTSYNWGTNGIVKDQAAFGREQTVAVGSFKPNGWGLYDMHGNVWEWCADWYRKDYPGGTVTDPVGPTSGERRVLRGGSWSNIPECLQSACRFSDAPGYQDSDLGFRLLLEN